LETEIFKLGPESRRYKYQVWRRKGHQKYANWSHERDALELEAENSWALLAKEKFAENSKIPRFINYRNEFTSDVARLKRNVKGASGGGDFEQIWITRRGLWIDGKLKKEF